MNWIRESPSGFTISDGQTRVVTLKKAMVSGIQKGPLPYAPGREGVVQYGFRAELVIDGVEVHLTRRVPSQRNFTHPPTVMGLHLWLDATRDVQDVLEQHGPSSRYFPRKTCRLAIWPAGERICPVLLHPWCPLPPETLRVEDCYRGEDVWMGPYDGCECHGGLDINHPAGTPLWTPLEIHEQADFAKVGIDGANNNRWRGWHHWTEDTSWFLQSHHHVRLLVEEGAPLAAGTHYAEAAGVLSGAYEHTHFVFGIRRGEQEVQLDPWLLFHQMYLDRKRTQCT